MSELVAGVLGASIWGPGLEGWTASQPILAGSRLLRLDLEAGHGMGSTATQRNAQAADIYAFLLWQMGKTTLKP